MSEAPAPEIQPLFQAWLLRHELPDAYARWREADPGRAPVLAFTAVACDGKLLRRLGGTAARIVRQAEQFAASVLQSSKMSEEARAAAMVVRVRAETWRKAGAAMMPVPAPRQGASASESPPAQELTLEDHLRNAVKDYPYYRESTARILFLELLRHGAAGLQQMGAPFDDAIVLAACRYAARTWRGLIRGNPPSRQNCMTAVALIQQWAMRSGKSSFTIELSQLTGGVDELVVALWRDVATCLGISLQFPGGALAPGFAVWEEAEEYLSCAVLSVRPAYVNQMTLEEARSFASAATRLATAAADERVHVPTFSPEIAALCPRRALATTRALLPNGPDPRRSALAATVAAGASREA